MARKYLKVAWNKVLELFVVYGFRRAIMGCIKKRGEIFKRSPVFCATGGDEWTSACLRQLADEIDKRYPRKRPLHRKREGRMTEELKPCPFCGGDAKIVRDFMGHAYRKGTRKWLYFIECTNIHCPICPQTGQTNQRQRLINDWNRRPPVDSVGVDMPASCEECPVLKHCNWHYGRHQESGTIYEGNQCKSLLFDHFAALTAPADGCEGCRLKRRGHPTFPPCNRCSQSAHLRETDHFTPTTERPTPQEGGNE